VDGRCIGRWIGHGAGISIDRNIDVDAGRTRFRQLTDVVAPISPLCWQRTLHCCLRRGSQHRHRGRKLIAIEHPDPAIPLHRVRRHAALNSMQALDLLRLQIEWGADEALEDAPVDRLVPPALPRPPEAARHTPTVPPVPSSPLAPAERALAAAGASATLVELRAAVAAFDGCALRDTAASLVFAEGDPASGLLLIGDPPGEWEERSGAPFAGPGGALLERMLASIALTRQDLMLAPLIPWRPPGGRPPSAAEIAVCLPFLHRLIVLSGPRRIILAGALPARTLLGSGRRRTAPAWIGVTVPGRPDPIPGLVMPSSASVMQTPAARQQAWAALRLLRRTLDRDIAEK